MFPFLRLPITLIALGAVLTGGIFLYANDHLGPLDEFFRAHEAFYTDVLPDAVLSSPATTSPTGAPQATVPATATTSVPILVYHIVRPSYPTDTRAVKALAHTPEVFDAQMKYLADAGYHVVSFADLERHLTDGAPLPKNPIIISFDDGWSDQFTYAFPILKKYHYTATFFVFINPIGRRGFVSWSDLREMRDAGMTIGSHSKSHPFLTKITDPTVLWSEIDDSKKTLEKNLGITVNEFAYPFGQYNADIVALVKKAGYTSARGDYYRGAGQTMDRLYGLSALNAPTTTELFARKFPAR